MTARLRRAVLVAVAVALLVSVGPTGAFSAVEAERGVHVAVVPDSEAYLAVESAERDLANGTNEDVPLLGLENQFPSDLTTVSATVTETSLVEDGSVETPDGLGVGEHGEVTATVVCDGDGETAELTVKVETTGSGVAVELRRTVHVSCPATA